MNTVPRLVILKEQAFRNKQVNVFIEESTTKLNFLQISRSLTILALPLDLELQLIKLDLELPTMNTTNRLVTESHNYQVGVCYI